MTRLFFSIIYRHVDHADAKLAVCPISKYTARHIDHREYSGSVDKLIFLLEHKWTLFVHLL